MMTGSFGPFAFAPALTSPAMFLAPLPDPRTPSAGGSKSAAARLSSF
jgi:hypothetical protein